MVRYVVLATAFLVFVLAFACCGLSNVQRVKLACAESAEGLAREYRAAKGADALRALDAKATERGALCNEPMYRAVESGAADVPRLVSQIAATGGR